MTGGVVVAGATALALTLAGPKAPPPYRSPVDVGPAVNTTADTTTAAAPAAGGDAAGAGETTAPESRGSVAVVLGDGLSARPNARTSFACTAVVRRGWSCRNYAKAGSGYAAGGSGGTYAAQLAKASSLDTVGLVVVTGGGVDRSPAAGTAARTLVARAVFEFPGATVVVVPPFGDADTASATAIRKALQASADGDEVRFVDPAGWFRDVPKVIAADGASLTTQARTVAAQRLASALPTATG